MGEELLAIFLNMKLTPDEEKITLLFYSSITSYIKELLRIITKFFEKVVEVVTLLQFPFAGELCHYVSGDLKKS